MGLNRMLNYVKVLKEKGFSKFFLKDDGISLIEAAVGVVILGLISVPLFQAMRIEQVQRTYKETAGGLSDVRSGINQYYALEGAYPCPASLTAQEGDVDFGSSQNFTKPTCELVDLTLCSDPSWPTAGGGVCKTSNDPVNAVVIGALPFVNLKASHSYALDVWSHKILYGVSFMQTDPDTYVIGAGVVNVLVPDDPNDPAADGVPEPHSSLYDFVLVSHGETKVGAYNKDGLLVSACPAFADGIEVHNCDMDNQFLLHVDPSNLAAAAANRVVGNNFYDDITSGQDTIPADSWFQHPDNSAYPDQDYLLTIANRIGVGLLEPAETIHVAGAIRVEDTPDILEPFGNLKARSLCSYYTYTDPDTGVETDVLLGCFDPELFAGTKDQMKCDPADLVLGDQVITQVLEGHVVCNTSLDAGDSSAGTPPSPIPTSVDSSGNPYAPSAAFPVDATKFN